MPGYPSPLCLLRWVNFNPAEIDSQQLFTLDRKKSVRYSCAMNFQTLLIELVELGYTQTAIAKICACSIPTIHDLISGKSQMPSYRLGSCIIELNTDAKRKAKRTAKRQARKLAA